MNFRPLLNNYWVDEQIVNDLELFNLQLKYIPARYLHEMSYISGKRRAMFVYEHGTVRLEMEHLYGEMIEIHPEDSDLATKSSTKGNKPINNYIRRDFINLIGKYVDQANTMGKEAVFL